MSSSSSSQEKPALRLRSSQGDIVEISRSAARLSKLLHSMLEEEGDVGAADGEQQEEIPLPNLTTPLLQKVAEWLEHHGAGDNPCWVVKHPLEHSNLAKCGASKFDCDFVDVEEQELSDLLTAANYLDIKPLMELVCAKIACNIREMPLDEVRQKYNPNWAQEDSQLQKDLDFEARWQHDMELREAAEAEKREQDFWRWRKEEIAAAAKRSGSAVVVMTSVDHVVTPEGQSSLGGAKPDANQAFSPDSDSRERQSSFGVKDRQLLDRLAKIRQRAENEGLVFTKEAQKSTAHAFYDGVPRQQREKETQLLLQTLNRLDTVCGTGSWARSPSAEGQSEGAQGEESARRHRSLDWGADGHDFTKIKTYWDRPGIRRRGSLPGVGASRPGVTRSISVGQPIHTVPVLAAMSSGEASLQSPPPNLQQCLVEVEEIIHGKNEEIERLSSELQELRRDRIVAMAGRDASAEVLRTTELQGQVEELRHRNVLLETRLAEKNATVEELVSALGASEAEKQLSKEASGVVEDLKEKVEYYETKIEVLNTEVALNARSAEMPERRQLKTDCAELAKRNAEIHAEICTLRDIKTVSAATPVRNGHEGPSENKGVQTDSRETATLVEDLTLKLQTSEAKVHQLHLELYAKDADCRSQSQPSASAALDPSSRKQSEQPSGAGLPGEEELSCSIPEERETFVTPVDFVSLQKRVHNLEEENRRIKKDLQVARKRVSELEDINSKFEQEDVFDIVNRIHMGEAPAEAGQPVDSPALDDPSASPREPSIEIIRFSCEASPNDASCEEVSSRPPVAHFRLMTEDNFDFELGGADSPLRTHRSPRFVQQFALSGYEVPDVPAERNAAENSGYLDASESNSGSAVPVMGHLCIPANTRLVEVGVIPQLQQQGHLTPGTSSLAQPFPVTQPALLPMQPFPPGTAEPILPQTTVSTGPNGRPPAGDDLRSPDMPDFWRRSRSCASGDVAPEHDAGER